MNFDPSILLIRAEVTAEHWRKKANDSEDTADKVKAAKAEGLVKQINHLLELAKRVRDPRDPVMRQVARNRDLVVGLLDANEKQGIKLLPAPVPARR